MRLKMYIYIIYIKYISISSLCNASYGKKLKYDLRVPVTSFSDLCAWMSLIYVVVHTCVCAYIYIQIYARTLELTCMHMQYLSQKNGINIFMTVFLKINVRQGWTWVAWGIYWFATGVWGEELSVCVCVVYCNSCH